MESQCFWALYNWLFVVSISHLPLSFVVFVCRIHLMLFDFMRSSLTFDISWGEVLYSGNASSLFKYLLWALSAFFVYGSSCDLKHSCGHE